MAAGAAGNQAVNVALEHVSGSPTGVGTLISGHYKGIRAAMKGDNAGVASAAGGVWGGLAGGLTGFLCGGPVGAFIGGVAGGFAVGSGAGALVKSQIGEPSANNGGSTIPESFQVEIPTTFLGRFNRSPRCTQGNTAQNNHCEFVIENGQLIHRYENQRNSVRFDPLHPNVLYITIHVAHRGDMVTMFSMRENGSYHEVNEQLNEQWDWIPN
jgi:hypothetical protein